LRPRCRCQQFRQPAVTQQVRRHTLSRPAAAGSSITAALQAYLQTHLGRVVPQRSAEFAAWYTNLRGNSPESHCRPQHLMRSWCRADVPRRLIITVQRGSSQRRHQLAPAAGAVRRQQQC
jgi:hypothetical protein